MHDACSCIDKFCHTLMLYLCSRLQKIFGVSGTRYGICNLFSSLTTMMFMPFAARLFRKIPMKRLLYIRWSTRLSQIIYSVASKCDNVYVGGIIAGVATCLYGAVPIAILTSNWFYEKVLP